MLNVTSYIEPNCSKTHVLLLKVVLMLFNSFFFMLVLAHNNMLMYIQCKLFLCNLSLSSHFLPMTILVASYQSLVDKIVSQS